jgi:hypothetical protein
MGGQTMVESDDGWSNDGRKRSISASIMACPVVKSRDEWSKAVMSGQKR